MFALDLHIIVGADSSHHDRQYLPGLPLAMTAGRPGADPAGAARRMMAALAAQGHTPGYLAGDNLYVLTEASSFQQPARELGWLPVLPYPTGHTGLQGSTAGAPLVEGRHYCAAIPDVLVTATQDLRAKTISPEVYAIRIAERDRFALRAKEKPRPGVAERWGCPASGANPTAKCPLKPRSEQSRPTTTINGQHVDLRPRVTPSDDLQQQPPKVCRQDTITIQPYDGAKYRQTLPYGSPEHSRVYYLLRETQEGLHGFSKDDARESLGTPSRRRSRGLAANSIVASILLASAGIRKVRSFLESATPDDHGVLSIPRGSSSPETGPPGVEPARDI